MEGDQGRCGKARCLGRKHREHVASRESSTGAPRASLSSAGRGGRRAARDRPQGHSRPHSRDPLGGHASNRSNGEGDGQGVRRDEPLWPTPYGPADERPERSRFTQQGPGRRRCQPKTGGSFTDSPQPSGWWTCPLSADRVEGETAISSLPILRRRTSQLRERRRRPPSRDSGSRNRPLRQVLRSRVRSLGPRCLPPQALPRGI